MAFSMCSFKKFKVLCNDIVSGEVRFVFIILLLYLTPKVPIEATDKLFNLNNYSSSH